MSEWTIFSMETKEKSKKKDKKKKKSNKECEKMTYSDLCKKGDVGLYHCETTGENKIKTLLYKAKTGYPLVVSELPELKIRDYKKYLEDIGITSSKIMYESKVHKLDITESEMKTLIRVIDCQIDRNMQLKRKLKGGECEDE